MSPRRRALSVVLVGLLALGSAVVVTAPAAAATTADLRISEVDTDPADFIELVNTGAEAVDASGLIVKDNADVSPYTIPAGTTIEAGGLLVIDTTGYGLSGNDSARLFAADGTTLIDSWSWTGGHAVHSFARCGGVMQQSAGVTKGTANSCPDLTAALVINEVDTDPADFIELANVGATPLYLSGLVLKDDDDTHAFTIAAGTLIAVGGYAAFDVDVAGGFGLSGNDSARLFATDGTTLLDSQTWSGGHAPFSFGLCPDPTGTFGSAATAVTRGAANTCGTVAPDYSPLVINEVQASGDWVEIMNTGTAAVDAGGLLLKDSGESNTITIPSPAVIPAGGFLAVDVTGLGGGGDTARLLDGATLLDDYTWTSAADATWGACPDGSDAFVDTDGATKGAANDCPTPVGADDIVINEIESSGGDPADWVELVNTGAASVDLSGWIIRDSDDTHTFTIPASTSIAAGGYYVAVVDVVGGFGLGNDDRARLYLADGVTLVDERIWGPDHAATTFGLCPDGTGSFVQTFTSTKGARNDCSPVRINEVDSSGATPVDWIELLNAGTSTVDLGGYQLKDSDDTHVVTIPAGTLLAAGDHLAIDVDVSGGFGLGAVDSARLFDAGGVLLDTTSWTEHSPSSWGRCPDGTGGFEVTGDVTKGAANDCVGLLDAEAWPGPGEVSIVDAAGTFAGDLSGLAYEPSSTEGARGILWGVVNDGGVLHRLVWDGSRWTPAPGAWSDGTVLRYPDGSGIVDAEGVAFGGDSPSDGVYVASERDDSPATSGVSRPSVLRYDVPASPGATLSATREWNLTGVIPPVGNNTGLEGIAFIPDAFLTAKGFVDSTTGALYDPADYPTHGDGLFFVGVEATGEVYALALGSDGSAVLVATIDPRLSIVADVTFDAATGTLWAVCDEACQGRTVTLEIAQSGAFDGEFVPTHLYENPTGMADTTANEGFAIASPDLCLGDELPVWYADDADGGGFSLREAALDCVSDDDPGTDPGTPAAPSEEDLTDATEGGVSGPSRATAGSTITIEVGAEHAGEEVDVWMFSAPRLLGTFTVAASGSISVTIPPDVSAGAHRIAVLDAAGTVLGWFAIAIDPAALGDTGGVVVWQALPFAAASVLGGLVVLIVSVRRRRVA